MGQSVRKLSLSVIILVISVVCASMILPARADPAPSDWLSLTEPVLGSLTEKQVDVLPETLSGGNRDCATQTVLTKMRPQVLGIALPFTSSLTHQACSIDTPFGSISATGFLTRAYTSLGGNLFDANGFKLIPIAIPNSDKLMYIEPGTGGADGARLRIVDNFDAHVNSLPVNFTVTHLLDNTATTHTVSDQAGRAMSMRADNMAFSANGKWMVGDAPRIGVFRLNIETGEVIFMDSSFAYDSGTTPLPQFAISGDGRYVVVGSPAFSRFKLFDMNTCQANTTLNTKSQCQFRDLQPFMKTKVSGFMGAYNIRFSDPYTLKLYVVYQDASGQRFKSLTTLSAAGHTPVSFGYLGLGDSFASGEGIGEYRAGTDVKSPYNKCHTSQQSYSFLIGTQLNLSQYESVACSGAVIDDIGLDAINTKYTKDPQSKGLDDPLLDDNIINNLLPGYRTQVTFVKNYKPSIITISVSGNDIGFSDIVQKCTGTSTCYEYYEDRFEIIDRVNSQFDRLVKMYTALQQAGAPGAKIYAIGYPSLIKENGDCGMNVRANNGEAYFYNDLTHYINLVIKKAADRAGVSYIDVENALDGHRLCETDKYHIAVNGLSDGEEIPLNVGPIGKESYHPNKLGHELLAQTILQKTNNFTLKNPQPRASTPAPIPSDADYFLKDRPFKGRFVYKTNTIQLEAEPVLQKFIDENISAKGFAPGKVAHIELQSDPTDLGSVTADQAGIVKTSIHIPASVTPGFHTLHLYGKNTAGEDIDFQKVVYVAETADDYDGDGVPNSREKCLAVEPANVDFDQDGIDDACDPVISDPPPPALTEPEQQPAVADPGTTNPQDTQNPQPAGEIPAPADTAQSTIDLSTEPTPTPIDIPEDPSLPLPVLITLPEDSPKLTRNDETIAGNEQIIEPAQQSPAVTPATQSQPQSVFVSASSPPATSPPAQSGTAVLGATSPLDGAAGSHENPPANTNKVTKKSNNFYWWLILLAAFFALFGSLFFRILKEVKN